MEQINTDVLVMGAGLAGLTAARWAARKGADVCIAANGEIGSGSSFYPGTWGLGLIGPETKEDEADLLQVILETGEGMADEKLAAVLVSGAAEGIAELKELGAEIKDAVNKNEREFVPCFDKKCRDWHGIVKGGTKRALLTELERLGVQLFPETAITDILTAQGQVYGAEGIKLGKGGGLRRFCCKSLIIAGGGLGGLFAHRLNTPDVTGIGQFLALKAGASLINLEFMQMMPGFLHPAPKTIYNEKVFRYSEFTNLKTGKSIFADWNQEDLNRRMDVRSGHGPFTSRLASAPVDIRMFQEVLANPEGILLTYKKELRENQPEFVKTYFTWLKEEKGLTVDDPVRLGIFAHASNGGIRIDAEAGTGIKGLFACGEAAGGMHGADRLGGLSTANALVFGKIAGCSAARWSREGVLDESASRQERQGESWQGWQRESWQERQGESWQNPQGESRQNQKEENQQAKEKARWIISDAGYLLNRVRELNYRAAMVVREEHTLISALEQLDKLREEAMGQRICFSEAADKEKREETLWENDKTTRELEAALYLSQALLQAALLRRESRGPHFRLDYPKKDELLRQRIIHRYRNGQIHTDWLDSSV